MNMLIYQTWFVYFQLRSSSFLRDIKGEVPEETRLSDRKGHTKAETVPSYDMALVGLINFILGGLLHPDGFPVSQA